MPIFTEPVTFIDNGYGDLIQVTIYLSLEVRKRLYIGHLPITRIRGLLDEHTGNIVTNAFTTDYLDAEEVENTWQRLTVGEPLPFKPVISVVGLDCYSYR